jgi:hypothetical protein
LPKISEFYGRGEVLEPESSDIAAINKRFARELGVRSIIRVGLTRIQDSCGSGVPLYKFQKPRDTLLNWEGEQGFVNFKREHNACSIYSLPALEVFERSCSYADPRAVQANKILTCCYVYPACGNAVVTLIVHPLDFQMDMLLDPVSKTGSDFLSERPSDQKSLNTKPVVRRRET